MSKLEVPEDPNMTDDPYVSKKLKAHTDELSRFAKLNIREQAQEVFRWAEDQGRFSVSWKGHSENVARVAETIARQCGMDADRAYAYGLLHDIGRYGGPEVGLEHGIIGYNLLMERGMPDAAKISMTHTYYGYPEIDRTEIWEDFGDLDDLEFTLSYMDSVEMDEYDRLIQLADHMALAAGVMTINNRLCDVCLRHHLVDMEGHLRALHKIKDEFDEKCKMNIYELFKDDIIETMMLEPRG